MKLPVKIGIIFRWGSLWVGAHWASYNKRLCVNLLPCCTVWMIWEGGKEPTK
jgi:hypothetical protein